MCCVITGFAMTNYIFSKYDIWHCDYLDTGDLKNCPTYCNVGMDHHSFINHISFPVQLGTLSLLWKLLALALILVITDPLWLSLSFHFSEQNCPKVEF
jgi:hypothetical protein